MLARRRQAGQLDFRPMIYESDRLLAEYLLFHYGTAEEILPAGGAGPAGMAEALDFPVRTAARFSAGTVDRGLDLGCAVGRSTFEMARSCREVTGVDFSHAFIAAAQALKRGEALRYERLDEGNLRTPLVARAPEGIDASSRVHFLQGDAMRLPMNFGGFDRVHAANLLCRLREPALLLRRLASLVNPGGELVVATPCTWLEEFTPRENWPQGRTLDWLAEWLTPDFTLLGTCDEPFLIRETARKFQWTLSQTSVWRRREDRP